MQIEKIEINIATNADEVAESFKRLSAAIETAGAALDRIKEHGGSAQISIVGSIACLTISHPGSIPRSPADEITELRNILKRASNPETQRP